MEEICSCVEIMQEIKEIKDMLRSLLNEGAKSKRKRKPSRYNIFIGECMKSGKTMKECALLYKEKKNNS